MATTPQPAKALRESTVDPTTLEKEIITDLGRAEEEKNWPGDDVNPHAGFAAFSSGP